MQFTCIHKEQYERLFINVAVSYLQSFDKYACHKIVASEMHYTLSTPGGATSPTTRHDQATPRGQLLLKNVLIFGERVVKLSPQKSVLSQPHFRGSKHKGTRPPKDTNIPSHISH